MDLPLNPNILRDYQREGIDAIKTAWDLKKKPMVVVATGGGKTTMIAQLLVETVPREDRALIVAHTEEIVSQIHKTIQKQYGDSVGIVMGIQDDMHSQIIVATRQSLSTQRLSRLGMFDVIVIDEAHHATPENTYGQIVRKILKKNQRTKLVGFTATPTGDERLFDEIVFSWTISDGVNSGYLVPSRHINVSVDDLKNVNYSQGRLMGGILDSKNWVKLTMEAFKIYIQPSNRACLAFFPSVEMSRRFSQALKRHGISAAHIDGETPREEREFILSAYKNGEIQIVCNMAVLTEGFDAPNTSAILMARPTRSQTLITQILGRGLRTAPGKRDCLIVWL